MPCSFVLYSPEYWGYSAEKKRLPAANFYLRQDRFSPPDECSAYDVVLEVGAALPTTLLKVGSEINKEQLKITKGNTPEIHNADLYFF